MNNPTNIPLSSSRWWRLIPIVFITYSLAYLDRANYSFAAASGMAGDLKITSAMSSLLGALFFLGYFAFQIPGTLYAEKRSVKRLIFWCLIGWGSLATVTGMISNIPALMAIRFFLGAFEAAVMPAMVLYVSSWFTSSERSRANAFLMLGNPVTVLWMSIVSGYLVQTLNWRWMFIIEGLPSILWAFCWWMLVQDKPSQAKWLSQQEKDALERTLAEEQKGKKPMNYGEAFRSGKVILFCAQFFLQSIGIYGYVLWLPSIIKQGSGLNIADAGWLSAGPYLAAVIGMIVVSWLSDRFGERRRFVYSSLIIGGLGFFGSYLVGAQNFWLSYALLIVGGIGLYVPTPLLFAMIREFLPGNVAGGATALVNSMGALGAFLGSFFVGYLNGVTGSPTWSFMLMSLALLISGMLVFFMRSRSASGASCSAPEVSPNASNPGRIPA
ncbi:MAG TPA: MFS transporter [Chthoniobacterales bacterium]